MVQDARSRRTFLRTAAAAAAVPVAAELAACSTSAGPAARQQRHQAARTARVRHGTPEGQRPGDPRWDIRHLGAPDAIVGYAGVASALPGQPVPLFVSTTARSFRVLAFRMGWYRGDLARLIWASGTIKGRRQASSTLVHATNTVTTSWGPSLSLPTHDWPPGSYLLRLDAEHGAQRFVPLTIRTPDNSGKVVIKNSTATWQAYNMWGGYDLYNGPAGIADYGNRSLAVSLDRPFDLNGAFMFLAHERKLIQLAEKMGLPLGYASSMDLATDADLLRGASAVISGGHDEYWSPPERANVTAARNAGVNVAFFGANCMFRRTRLAATKQGSDRLVICYKTSWMRDPMYGKDNALVTSDWREPPDRDPESSITGTLYESNPVDAAFVVVSPDSWLFRDTGVRHGTRFPGLVGIEYDRVNPDSPVERPIEIMSHSPLTCRGINSYSDSAYYTHRSGAGVFNAGTMRWVRSFSGNIGFGIDQRAGRFVRQVSANVLRAFADGPAAEKYPAHDNLAEIHEWAGDPIGAQHNLW
ncbi:MAG TPA: N,N-dimethylformamidase beta subunit family domain-containing protein [Streptosporangiaceae bacterium]|nr:N,N-dimethylformamidase beta subunit family domain-containing protein [Streptosporangiaceae bacterium]